VYFPGRSTAAELDAAGGRGGGHAPPGAVAAAAEECAHQPAQSCGDQLPHGGRETAESIGEYEG